MYFCCFYYSSEHWTWTYPIKYLRHCILPYITTYAVARILALMPWTGMAGKKQISYRDGGSKNSKNTTQKCRYGYIYIIRYSHHSMKPNKSPQEMGINQSNEGKTGKANEIRIY